MSLSDKLPRGIRRLFRLPPSYERRMRDLDEEIRFHIRDARRASSRERHVGVEARRRRRSKRFGDADDLRTYCGAIAARREPATTTLAMVRRARRRTCNSPRRQIARAPAFTATAALILALGIGANTGVFSVVNHLLISPFPFADGNRMVAILATSGGGRILITPVCGDGRRRGARVRGPCRTWSCSRKRTFTLGDSTRGQTRTIVRRGDSTGHDVVRGSEAAVRPGHRRRATRSPTRRRSS